MKRLRSFLLPLALFGASAHAQPFFDAPWRAFETGPWEDGRYTAALTAADLNGDGLPDAVLGQQLYSKGLRVMLNQGDGTYGPPAAYPTTYNAWAVAAADLDGDGDTDLAATNSDDYYINGRLVAVFRNAGNGTFGAPTYFDAGPAGPNGISAADFDGDGDTDLAVANYGDHGTGNAVSVLKNNGGASFAAPAVYAVGSTAYRVEAGDLDGDGDADLVVSHDEYQVSVLFNNGIGAFGAPVIYANLAYPWTQPFFSDVALADVEADGDLDVLYTNSRLYGQSSIDPHFLVLRNNGSGALAAPQVVLYQIPYENVAFDLETADLNGDGYPDVLGAQMYEAGYIVIMNNGSGAFLAGQQYAAAGSAHVIAAADADGDGDADVLTANRLSRLLTVHENPGTGAFPERLIHGRTFAHTVLDVGDVDNDGDPDVVTSHGGSAESDVNVHLNTGGTYAESYSTPLAKYAYGKLRDLNGDGDLDLLFVTGPTGAPELPYDFWTAMGNGDGTFGAVVQWSLNACGLGHPDAFDVDGDGDLDVVNTEHLGCFGGTHSRLFISLNNGNGTFQPPLTFQGGLFPHTVSAGDFDEDGEIDLVTGGYSASAILFGNGDGTFQPWQELQTARVAENVLVLDLNGDGHLDLATLDLNEQAQESHLSVLLGDGTGAFAETEYGAHPTQNFRGWVTPGDVDGDGDTDLMTNGLQDAAVFLNDGSGAFAYSGRYGLAKGGFAPHYADATGDGLGDLIALGTHEQPPAGLEQGIVVVQGLEGQTAPVAVTAQPVGGPITIGPGGGSFQFRVTLTNTTGQPQTFQAWTAVTGPVGREPVVGPKMVTLPAGAVVVRTLTQRVPGNAPAGSYTYHVRLGTLGGVVTASDSFPFEKEGGTARGAGTEGDWSVSGWDEAASASAVLPNGFALSAASPNPSRAGARLALELAEGQLVTAAAFDALGRVVAVLHDGPLEAGAHTLALDGASLPAGVYVVRVTGGTFSATRRVTLVR